MNNFKEVLKKVMVIGGSVAFIIKNFDDEKGDFTKPLCLYRNEGIYINYANGLYVGEKKSENIKFCWNPKKYKCPSVKQDGQKVDDGGFYHELILKNNLLEIVDNAKLLATDYFEDFSVYLSTHKIANEKEFPKMTRKHKAPETEEVAPEVTEIATTKEAPKVKKAKGEVKMKKIKESNECKEYSAMALAHKLRKEIQKTDKISHYQALMSFCLKEAWAAKREGLTEEVAIAKIINFSEAKETKEKTKVTAKTKEAKAKKETKEVKAVKASKKTTNIAKVFVECVDGKFVPVMHTKRYLPQRNEVLAEGILAKRLEDFTDSAKKNGFKVQVKGTYPMLLDKAKKLGCIIVE